MTGILPYRQTQALATQNDLMRQGNPNFKGIPTNLPPGQYLIFPENSGNEPIYYLDETKMKERYHPVIGNNPGEGGFRVGLGNLHNTSDIMTPNLARLEERLDEHEFKRIKEEVEHIYELGSHKSVVFSYDENKNPVIINEIYHSLPVKVNGITLAQNSRIALTNTLYEITIGDKIGFCYVRSESPSEPEIIDP
jgi:hypothetical protein